MTGLNGALEACITSEQSRSPDPRSPNILWDATDLDVTRDSGDWLISKPQNLNEDMCLRSTAVGLAGYAHLGCVKTGSNLEQSDPKQRDLGTSTARIASHHVGATLGALPALHRCQSRTNPPLPRTRGRNPTQKQFCEPPRRTKPYKGSGQPSSGRSLN